VKLIEELASEHAVIERVAGSLRTFARQRAAGQGHGEDGPRFVEFFRLYAGQFHHAREEDVLFVALQHDAELPGDRGPIAAILDDHRRMGGLLSRMEALVAAPPEEGAEGAAQAFLDVALRYTEELWHHIDAENSVLFPESAQRLRRHAVAELPTREPTAAEEAARTAGEALVAAYPPVPEPDVLRGDGCVVCPAYERTCRGLEREWWNEWEWEEFEDHLPSG
jgi:hemerythrin-like domain-containing protein